MRWNDGPCRRPEPLDGTSAARVLETAQRAVSQMDPGELERVLRRAALAFSVPNVCWTISSFRSWTGSARPGSRAGLARPTNTWERWSSAVSWSGCWKRSMYAGGRLLWCPRTPAGEKHELGALLSAVSGAAEGWNGIFLGPDLPAEEIVSAALRLQAEVVTLSCVDPRTAETLPSEIASIRGATPGRRPPGARGTFGGFEGGSIGGGRRGDPGHLQGLRGRLRELGSPRPRPRVDAEKQLFLMMRGRKGRSHPQHSRANEKLFWRHRGDPEAAKGVDSGRPTAGEDQSGMTQRMAFMTEQIETDVLVIGCGIAGATAALELADAGFGVTVVTLARDPKESNTYYAQGGIVFRGEDDSPELLAKDIDHAGAGHCNPAAVKILAKTAPDFSRNS